MAEIQSIEMQGNEAVITLRMSREEYGILGQSTKNLLLLPVGNSLKSTLTTGKLGNSNRIMLPKKALEAHGVGELEKKVPYRMFNLDGDVFLLIRLKRSMLGIPKFGD